MGAESTVKVLMVEDYKLMRVGLKALLEDFPEIEIIAEAQNSKEAIAKVREHKPNVVLMDIGLPDTDGIKTTQKIIEQFNDVKVIILTSHVSEEEVNQAFCAGASAYVMKDIKTEYLAMIIKTVNEGAMWLDPKIVPFIKDKNSCIIPPRRLSRADFKAHHANLTEREYEVLKLVVDGKSNNQIAQELTISEHTAKAHVCNIIQKLVVDDRTQAAVKALKEGLV
jgi:DNA-binding NarL/FixJ family response regulator